MKGVVGVSEGVCRLGLDANHESLLRASQKPIQKAGLFGRGKTYESIFAPADALDLENLSRLDVVLLADRCREDDPALGGDRGLHEGKMSLSSRFRQEVDLALRKSRQ